MPEAGGLPDRGVERSRRELCRSTLQSDVVADGVLPVSDDSRVGSGGDGEDRRADCEADDDSRAMTCIARYFARRLRSLGAPAARPVTASALRDYVNRRYAWTRPAQCTAFWSARFCRRPAVGSFGHPEFRIPFRFRLLLCQTAPSRCTSLATFS